MRPTGLFSPSTLVTLVSARSVAPPGMRPERCGRTDGMGTAGTHAKVRYRCFLPDLAGFTSPRRPDHKLCDGESGIRTHDTLSSIHAFQACAFSLSAISPKGIYSGERRIRTYGTVTGTPDFESGA